jgi:nitrogenase molybdenum-iron protein alpha chain
MAIEQKVLDEMILPYPDKVKKNRSKHILRKNPDQGCQQIEANTRTVPVIMSQRGCAYAGCKGVVIGPIKDMITITHGPVGCGYYTWGSRRIKHGLTISHLLKRYIQRSALQPTCRSLILSLAVRRNWQR